MAINKSGLPDGQHEFADFIDQMLTREYEADDAVLVMPATAEIEMPYRLWRLDRHNLRYYYNPDRDRFYPSVTSVIDAERKESSYLKKWRHDMGLDQAGEYADMRAAYGTLMHMLITAAIRFGRMNTELIEYSVHSYRNTFELWHYDVRPWVSELTSDLHAFFQWAYELNMEPLATEMPISYPIHMPVDNGRDILIGHVAGTVDLVCRINMRTDGKEASAKTPKNKLTRGIAVVDYKSGKKGFHEPHKIQVKSYFDGYNWNVENEMQADKLKADRCYLWAPKNSTGGKATYHFKNYTDYKKGGLMASLLRQLHIDGRDTPKPIRHIEGDLEMGQSANANVEVISAGEYMKRQYEKQNQQDNE